MATFMCTNLHKRKPRIGFLMTDFLWQVCSCLFGQCNLMCHVKLDETPNSVFSLSHHACRHCQEQRRWTCC